MFLLLVAAGLIYLFMGERGDATLLLGFVIMVMGITVVQEQRTQRALAALRDLSSPRALVSRGGRRLRIAGREVVRGDILVLVEGDRVAAGALVRSAASVTVDESLLTGESVPVRNAASMAVVELDRPSGDDLPSVFAGTLVTAGEDIAEVLSTGDLQRDRHHPACPIRGQLVGPVERQPTARLAFRKPCESCRTAADSSGS
jgi:P-type Ca2+ transporter type 2C